jgi:predicted AAA+ superfamily ATPase
MISRHLIKKVMIDLDRMPAVALMGPRQVGKTTLAMGIAETRASVYLDLEDRTKTNACP